MKRTLTAIAIVLFAAAALASTPTVTVTAPNGAEYISGVSTTAFEWSDANESHTAVTADLYYRDGGGSPTAIASLDLLDPAVCSDADNNIATLNSCSYDWNTTGIADGNYLFRVTVSDDEGASASDESDANFTVDNTAPATTVAVTWSGSQNASDATITLGCSDATAGCKETSYRVDSGSWETYSAAFVISSDGNHLVEFYSTDNAGNTEAAQQTSVFIDQSGPSISDESPSSGAYTNDSTPSVCATITDSLSDVASVTITIDGIQYGVTGPPEGGTYCATSPAAFSTGYDVNAAVSAVDSLGNASYNEWVFTVDLDKPYPVTDLSASGSVVLDWSPSSDAISGISHYNVYRAEEPITEDNKGAFFLAQTTESTYDDTSAETGKEYYYSVTAVDLAENESILSNETRVSVPVTADIELYPRSESVFLERNDSIGVEFTVVNTSEEEQCVSFSGESDSAYLSAYPSVESICLNENERAGITLNIQTTDAPSSTFTASLVAETGSVLKANVAVTVGSGAEIELIASGSDICRGGGSFSVLVRNNSSEVKEVTLWADNEILLPYFEPSEITLDAFEEKYVAARVHTGQSTLLGEYTVSLFAATEEEQVKETVSVDVKDCDEGEIGFTVEVPAGCQYADKEEAEEVHYSVRNLGEAELVLRAAVISDLPTDYNHTITVEEGDTKTFSIIVEPRMGDAVGEHDLTLFVWNPSSGESTEQTKCVSVNEAEATSVEVVENGLLVEAGSSATFPLLVKNTGDINLSYGIVLLEDLNSESIETSASVEEFELGAKEQRYVYVAVDTAADAPLGEYSFEVMVEYDGESIVKTLEFTVVEELLEEEELEIASYPVQVKVALGGEKSFIVGIRNNTSGRLDGIAISIVGLPAGASAPPVENISLEAGESRSVQLYLSAGGLEEGSYTAEIVAESAEFKTTRPIEFLVEKEAAAAGEEAQEEEEGLLAGLITAGSNVLLGLVALAIVISLIVLLEKTIRGYSSKEPDEVWLKKA
jgi:fibronectin type 3 domain-containing protein